MVSAVPQRQYGPAYDILIVDNKELTRDMVQKILQQEGYTVDTARHGKEAIEKLRASQYGYRLIITEMIMPYAGGFEVIKTAKRESRIPVLVLSAVADEGTISEAFRLNADDFLKKPFMATELVQRIQRLLVRYAVPVYPGKPVAGITPVQPVAQPTVPQPVAQLVDTVVSRTAEPAEAVAETIAPKTTRVRKAVSPKPTAKPAPAKAKAKAATTSTARPAPKAITKTSGKTIAKTRTVTKSVPKPPAQSKTTAKTTTTKTTSSSSRSTATKKAGSKSTVGSKKTGSGKKGGSSKSVRPGEIKSKVIIRNAIPMIRLIPTVNSGRIEGKAKKLNVEKTAQWYCAVAV
jgi:DNA-binding response OmpR family regulator